jgi:hypothetical protein
VGFAAVLLAQPLDGNDFGLLDTFVTIRHIAKKYSLLGLNIEIEIGIEIAIGIERTWDLDTRS